MATTTHNPSARPVPTPNAMRCSAWWRVVRFGLCVVLMSLLISLLATPWLHLSWWRVFRRSVSIASAISLWFCIKKLEHRRIRSYGFSAHGAGKRELLFGLLLGFGVLAILLGLGLASGTCKIAINPDRVKLWGTVLGFLPLAVLVSVLEELAFRGFILQCLMEWSRPLAVAVSSALYSFVHLKTPTLSTSTYLELVGLFLLGAVLSFSYLRTQQLYLAVGLHASLAYGARVNKLLIGFPNQSLSWFVGTSRLVNGLASWMALLAIGGVLMWWTRSSHRGGVTHGKT